MAIKINGTTVIDDSRAGNLASLTTTGNANVGNIGATSGVFTGNIQAAYIFGNLAGNFDVDAAGSNTQVQFNDTGDKLGASAGFTFDKTANLMTVTGNVVGGNLKTAAVTIGSTGDVTGVTTLNASGNANVGNLGATNAVLAGSLTGVTTLSASGNANVGNIGAAAGVFTGAITGSTTMNITGNANVGNIGAAAGVFTGAITGSTTMNITGNANVGNLGTAGVVTATGNVSGGNLTTAGMVNATGNLTSGADITLQGNIYDANALTLFTAGLGNVSLAPGGTNAIVATTTGANITGTLNATGNANVANIGATNAVLAGSLSGVTTINASGNANVGNLGATNAVLAGSLTGVTTISASGNANVGNIGATAGVFTGTLNVTGNANTGNLGTTNVVATNLTGTLQTAAQPNVTSVGTLTGLNVTGNANVGNIGATAGVFTGAITGSTTMNITGNANTGNLGTTNVVATNLTGTLQTAAQPNITSVGTLSSLTATGTVTGGNLSTAGTLTVSGTGSSSIAGNLNMNTKNINNLATPVASTDAATKQYVDDVAQGLNVHDSVKAATTGTLATASGGTVTYNNGSSGVGATLTTTGSYTTIDGVNIATVGTRILVKNEANTAHNGVYTYTSGTVLTRATDYDSVPEVEAGDFIFVQDGTVYNDTGWVQTSAVATIGTDAIAFTQFSGAGTYNAGTGLTLTGTTFSVNASQTQVTAVGTLGTLTVSGNANVGNIGAAAGVFTGAISGSTTLSVTGNANVGNIGAAAGVFSGAVSVAGNLSTGTAAGNTNTTTVATTAFVVGQAGGATPGAVGSAAVGTSLRYAREDHTHSGVTSVNGSTGAVSGIAVTSGNLSQFAATTSAQLAGVISDETGSGSLVFATSPTLAGTPLSSNAAANTNTAQIATTAFVIGQAGGATPGAVGSAAVGTSTRYAREDHTHSGVTSITTSSGLSTNTSATGAVSITNTGVTSAVAGTGISVSGATGAVTITNSGVTSVNGSTGAVTGIATTAGNLAQFAATTSAQLAGVISDETGSGSLVFATSPTLAGTPLSSNAAANTNTAQIATTAFVIGQAGAATPGAVGSAAVGTSTRYAREDHTHSGVTSVNGSTGAVTNIATTTGTLAQFAATTSAQLAGVISDETGSGSLVFATSPTLTTPNIGAATGTSLNVSTGTVTLGGIVNANANGVGNIGSSTTYFNTVFAKATSAQYADLAEKYTADAEYAPGTVVVFGGANEVTASSVDSDRAVAGVVSTNPSYIMNAGLDAEFVATVALTGRVPTRVVGPVRKGDLMVATSDGRARAEADPKVGTVIGKALENFNDAEGVIEVVVGRF